MSITVNRVSKPDEERINVVVTDVGGNYHLIFHGPSHKMVGLDAIGVSVVKTRDETGLEMLGSPREDEIICKFDVDRFDLLDMLTLMPDDVE